MKTHNTVPATTGAALETLNQLRADAEAAVQLIHERREEFPNASVNWADFHAVGAELAISTMTDPAHYWVVVLEEAAPQNETIAAFVAEQLRERWGYVEVVTEW